MFFSRVYLFTSVAVFVAAVYAIPNPICGSRRDPVTGKKIDGSVSSANNTPVPKNTTVNNITITGAEGAQAACDRGFTAWCLTRREEEEEVTFVEREYEEEIVLEGREYEEEIALEGREYEEEIALVGREYEEEIALPGNTFDFMHSIVRRC